MLNNSWSFLVVVSDVRDSKFYQLTPEKENTIYQSAILEYHQYLIIVIKITFSWVLSQSFDSYSPVNQERQKCYCGKQIAGK